VREVITQFLLQHAVLRRNRVYISGSGFGKFRSNHAKQIISAENSLIRSVVSCPDPNLRI
jgi:hypothetical protein